MPVTNTVAKNYLHCHTAWRCDTAGEQRRSIGKILPRLDFGTSQGHFRGGTWNQAGSWGPAARIRGSFLLLLLLLLSPTTWSCCRGRHHFRQFRSQLTVNATEWHGGALDSRDYSNASPNGEGWWIRTKGPRKRVEAWRVLGTRRCLSCARG